MALFKRKSISELREEARRAQQKQKVETERRGLITARRAAEREASRQRFKPVYRFGKSVRQGVVSVANVAGKGVMKLSEPPKKETGQMLRKSRKKRVKAMKKVRVIYRKTAAKKVSVRNLHSPNTRKEMDITDSLLQ